MKKIIILIFVCYSLNIFSQNVGIGTKNPQSKLHINGQLRVDTILSGSISDSILTVDLNGVFKKINSDYFTNTSTFGDIKTGIQSSDHNGWILLNGRAKSTLTSSQQSRATALGIGVNLPNATGSVLMQNGTTLGTVSGSNLKTIVQSNLPNINLSGTTNVAGSHTHSYTDDFPNGGNWRMFGTEFLYNVFGSGNKTTGASGDHSHTVSVPLGGSGSPLDITPRSLSVNAFIYLGK